MIAYSMAVAPDSSLRNRAPSLMRPLTARLPHICPTLRASRPAASCRQSHANVNSRLATIGKNLAISRVYGRRRYGKRPTPSLIGCLARSADADADRKFQQADGLRPGNPRHRVQQMLNGAQRRQINRKTTLAQFVVTLQLLDRRRDKLLYSVRLFALGNVKPVEPINKPGVARNDVAVRKSHCRARREFPTCRQNRARRCSADKQARSPLSRNREI